MSRQLFHPSLSLFLSLTHSLEFHKPDGDQIEVVKNNLVVKMTSQVLSALKSEVYFQRQVITSCVFLIIRTRLKNDVN